MSFAEFMDQQIAEMAASDLTPDEWIARNAEAFRAAHPVTDTEDITQ